MSEFIFVHFVIFLIYYVETFLQLDDQGHFCLLAWSVPRQSNIIIKFRTLLINLQISISAYPGKLMLSN